MSADWVAREDWPEILPGVQPLCPHHPGPGRSLSEVDAATLFEESEKSLLKRICETAEKAMAGKDSVEAFISAFVPMVPAINTFFDAVLVMDEDEKVRQARLGLLTAGRCPFGWYR